MKYKFWNSLSRGPKNVFIIAFIFMASIAVLTKLTDYTRQVKVLSYSKFVKAIEADTVQSVHVAGQEVFGIARDGTRFEATIAENAPIYDLLKQHNVEYSVSSGSNAVSPWYFFFLVMFVGAPLAVWYFMRQAKGSNNGGGIFSMGKSRARMFTPSMIKANFDSVAGAQEAKSALQDIVDFLKNPEKYQRLGAKVPRGVLLVGEPGNGKTLLAKAVAGEANCPFFSITGSDFIEVFVGVGAARVRDLFTQARKQAPAIIFIDEIDAIGRSRGSGFGGGHDEREQTLNQLLTEMDGFETAHSPVIVIAATNMPDVLDKALLRPGRFDRWVTVQYPDTQAREQILRIHGRDVRLAEDVDLGIIARDTAGFSGADLANLMNEAAIRASKKNQDVITMEDLLEAHKHILQSREHSVGSTGGNALTRGTSKPKMFVPAQVKTKFADVAGIPEAKEELMEVVDFLKNPEKFKRLGARLPKGVLMVGDPGNGKTLLAKAVAGEANCPFFSVSGSDFIEIYVGVGASRVRELFAQARRHMPSIIFIDEIDAVGGKRNNGLDGGNDERAQTLNQLLTEMDGFNSDNAPVLVIAATNRPDILDTALTRPGRFDKRVDVPYPDVSSREKILHVHAKQIKIDESVQLDRIARGTPGFSGAELAHLVNEAAIIATKKEHALVTMHDFEEARDKIMLGKELKSVVLSGAEREMVAFHEAGHAMIRLLLPETADPLHKVTIVPRGSALGVTHSLPERDKYLSTEPELRTLLMVCLGGRVAELIQFKLLSSGASNDFEKATEIARRMVCQYGMDPELGPVVYKQNGERQAYSQKTAEKIDQAVQELLRDLHEKTRQLLEEHKDKLDRLAHALLEKETLYADEIYALLGIEPRESFRLVDQGIGA
ncbi:MAG: ATP-dependent zinc metalloprotease FtsH [Candidatus Babeliales bacterium]